MKDFFDAMKAVGLDVVVVDEEGARIIRSPGKFEGEPHWVPYFWDCYLGGDGVEGREGQITFEVLEQDVQAFPELSGVKCVRLWTHDNGFVTGETWRVKPL